MSEAVPEFAGLTLSQIGDLGVQVLDLDKSPGPPGEPAEKRCERANRRNIRNDDGRGFGILSVRESRALPRAFDERF